MRDLLILGTDTDAGKTTFAALWMSAFADAYEYWKPIETGPSDTETIRRLVPEATVHPPRQRFEAPVVPPLAAHMEGKHVLGLVQIAGARPAPTRTERCLLIETFGSPFSPVNEDVLQLHLIRGLGSRRVLVTSAAVGAIGRALQCIAALESWYLRPRAVVLLGPLDEYAAREVGKHCGIEVFSLSSPPAYDADSIRRSASAQRPTLHALELALGAPSPPSIRSEASMVRARELIAQDHTSVWHPYTPLVGADPPLCCVGAGEEFLHLDDGRRVIDAISSWWTILHGHRHPKLMTALVKGADSIDHVHFAGVTHRWATQLAEWLLRPFPWHGGRVFYSDNGSTAVEIALKMAYQFWCHNDQPRRTRFVGFEHGYHGDTFGAMAVSRDPVFFGRFEPMLLQADILPIDPAQLDEHLIRHRGQVAGIIIEPLVQGAGGMRMHTPEMLR